ncbi:MAG TPA: hypothetical protein VHD81_04100 [Mycobacteriales bacterium]|nr:hypothetical protein [Mycobacteriales bacterium]
MGAVRSLLSRAAFVIAAAPLAGACSGSSVPAAIPTPPPGGPPTCPAVQPSPDPTAGAAAIRGIPARLPLPPNLTFVTQGRIGGGVYAVHFTTPTSLYSSALFVVKRYPKAGFLLGRGDAEATEADTPWVYSGQRGLTRINEVTACQTSWVIAIVLPTDTNPNAPLLAPHATSTSTALPFG